MTISFVVPTKPAGKERPRLAGNGAVYTPAKTKAYENFIRGCYVEQCGDVSFGDRSISMVVKAYVPPLSKFNKKQREAALRGELRPTAKPDADNILKALLDALNELAYDDDRYIYRISVERIYSSNPRTEVIISDEICESRE